MTQRIADGRDAESMLGADLVAATNRSRALEALSGERAVEISRLKAEVAALTEIGKSSQTRLVAVQNLADARKRDADSLTNQLATERSLVSQTRQELAMVRSMAEQRLAQIGRLESDRKASADSFASQILEKNQTLVRRDQRIGALERSLEDVRSTSAKQAAELKTTEGTIGGLREAVSSLSSGLVK